MTVVVGAISIASMQQVADETTHLTNEVIPAVTNILGVKTELEKILVTQRTLLSLNISEQEYNRLFDDIAKCRKNYGTYLDEYKKTITAGNKEEEMFNNFTSIVKSWKEISDEFEGYRRTLHDIDLGNPIELAKDIAVFKGDHYNAILKLDGLIEYNIEYEGGTSDDSCSFGKWLASTQTKNDVINGCIESTKTNHKQFHEIIKAAKELNVADEKDKAHEKVKELKEFASQIISNITTLEAEVDKAADIETEMNHTLLVKSVEKQIAAEKQLEEIVKYETEIANTKGEYAAALTKSTANIIIGSIALTFIAAMAIGTILSMSITKPINKIIAELSKNSEQVQDASGQVASSSQVLAQGATEQAGGLEETSASVHEMSSMIQDNAQNSSEASELASKAARVAESGTQSMHKMNQAINEIQGSAEETSKIIKVIDEIAFQTNLLALNAAVEAARAGEAGKGFAVVAEEVRNLAMRSAEAARNTSTMIEESVSNSQNGVKISQEVDENLNEITGTIQQVAELIKKINAASQDESHHITQISSTMSSIDKVTQSNAASAEESASAAEELSCQAEEMGNVINKLVLLITGKEQQTNYSHKAKFSISDTSFHQIANKSQELIELESAFM